MATIVRMLQPLVGQTEHRRAEQPDDEDAQPERRPTELLERDGSGPGADEDRQAEHGRIRAGVLTGAPWRRHVGCVGAAGPARCGARPCCRTPGRTAPHPAPSSSDATTPPSPG